MDRRSMMKLSGAAIVGTAVMTQIACEKKDVDFYVATVTGALAQLKPFLPNQAVLLDKAVSIAKSVNQAYQDDKFKDALSLTNNLMAVINDIIAAAGVNLSDNVKMIIAIANVALGTVAVLIKNSVSAIGTPTDAMAVKMASMASSARVNTIFEASRFQ